MNKTLTAPHCGCGAMARKPTKNYNNDKSIIWLCNSGHATRVTYCSESDIKLIEGTLK